MFYSDRPVSNKLVLKTKYLVSNKTAENEIPS
jgi:hypothetical protein